ncbi:MAG: EpsG family protein [Oscillospiraceae bacterium]|nr:EpsG family protein [Oscillospiraceae bacterium]
MVYLISLAVIVAFAGILPPKYGLRQNNYRNYIWICGFLVLFVTAFRGLHVGADSRGYARLYKTLQTYDSFADYYDQRLSNYDLLSSEAGFYFTMWLLGRVFPDGQTAIISSSALTAVATCVFIRRNSKDIPLSLTIYVCLGLFTFNMSGMRQAMAMSICLFAYEFAKRRKLIPFVITVLIAMLFHKTAMCFFPMYFLPAMKNNLGSWLFYVFGLIACLLFIDKIIAGYYELSGEDYSDIATSQGGGVLVVMLYLGAIVIALYNRQILKRKSAQTALLATLTGFTAYIARYIGSDILERISYYYFYFVMLLIPEGFQELEDKEYELIKFFFILGALALYIYRLQNSMFKNFDFYFV